MIKLLLFLAKFALSLPVFGNYSTGYYYMDVGVGTPPQTQALLFDSVNVTAFVCAPCPSCNKHMYASFDPTLSTTLDPNLKNFTFQEGSPDGSGFSGYLIFDQLSLGGSKISMNLGCIKSQSSFYYDKRTNGVLSTQQIFSKVGLSICLGFNGGQFQLTGKAPLLSNFNDLQMSLSVGQNNIAKSQRFTLDVANANSFMQGNAFSKLIKQLDIACLEMRCQLHEMGLRKCYRLDGLSYSNKQRSSQILKAISKFPTIQLKVKNSVLSWLPIDYLVPQEQNLLCLSILPYSENIFGSTFFRHRQIRYDSQGIHFNESSCGQNVKLAFFNQLTPNNNQYTSQKSQAIIAIGSILLLAIAALGVKLCRKQQSKVQKVRLAGHQSSPENKLEDVSTLQN